MLSARGAAILMIAVLISVLGILSIYSIASQEEGGFWQAHYRRQIVWVLLGIVFFFVAANFSYRRLWEATYPLYGAALFLLLMVFTLGVVRLGAQRWLKFGWLNFQPSEIAKFALVVFYARYYSFRGNTLFAGPRGMGPLQALLVPLAFTALPVGLIIEQPDLGSGIIIMLVFFAMLYAAGVKLLYIASFAGAGIALMPFVWHFLRGYQKERLLVFLNPNIDPLGAGYTVIQSRIAIGSGALFGKGWLAGTQSQLRFLPEAHTDFIFATFAEQWGFCGSAILLCLYFLLIRLAVRVATRTSDDFGRLLALGLAFMFSIQVAVNIAMNLGFAPVVGVPLYLMSYGGSSVCISFLALGILANIDKQRSVF